MVGGVAGGVRNEVGHWFGISNGSNAQAAGNTENENTPICISAPPSVQV